MLTLYYFSYREDEMKELSTDLEKNIKTLKELFPIGKSFDLITRNLILGNVNAFWIGVNGFCGNEVLRQIFSDLQNPEYIQKSNIKNIELYMNSKIGYSQTELSNDWNKIEKSILSGPSVLFLDGFNEAIIIDTRSYPARGIQEPDIEKVTRGAKDGFVETLVFNTALIRRRIRSPQLTFEMIEIGTDSKTDVAVGYIGDKAEIDLLNKLKEKLKEIVATSLTMGSKSLEELLVKKSLFHPLPSLLFTERPDVACSYLLEGHIVIIIDNSPSAIILPCTIFQFTQSPEDYYKSPAVGNYVRIVRFLCIILSLFLMPAFLLLGGYIPNLPTQWDMVTTEHVSPAKLFIYVLFIEFGLDLFKYSSSIASSRFSNSLSIIGGLIISDVAIKLHWANIEAIFYGASTMLATLSLTSIEFGEGLRIYRIFLVIAIGFFGLPGFWVGTLLVLYSIITTPTFAKKSYFWPLYPFNWEALKTLLFRRPTSKAQPSKVWNDKA